MKPCERLKPEVFLKHSTTVIIIKQPQRHSISRKRPIGLQRFGQIFSVVFMFLLLTNQRPINKQISFAVDARVKVEAQADAEAGIEVEMKATSRNKIAQDVTLELDASSGLYGDDIERNDEQNDSNKMKSLDEFLQSLPTLSVGQKHTASFECELDNNKELDSFMLIWLKLNRVQEGVNRESVSERAAGGLPTDDTMLISLNQKLITRDKRFKVRRQSPAKWLLSIDNVGPEDNHAYYLCQASATSSTAKGGSGSRNRTIHHEESASRFVGGARLNVLVPPKIIEQETSGSLVLANEFEPLSLRCKVVSEPQSQIMWKREDGKSMDQLEQRLKHLMERKQSGEILSIDSSELIFSSFNRQQSGAYLCIASNGVQPGVSQRMSVQAVNCRVSPAQTTRTESCELRSDSDSTELVSDVSQAPIGPPKESVRKSWKTSVSTKQGIEQRRQQRLPADKRRTPGNGRNDGSQVSIKQAGDSMDPMQTVKSSALASGLISQHFSISVTAFLCALLLHFGRNIITITFITPAAL